MNFYVDSLTIDPFNLPLETITLKSPKKLLGGTGESGGSCSKQHSHSCSLLLPVTHRKKKWGRKIIISRCLMLA